MPYSCCVPGCRGNYTGGPKVSTYRFPKDEYLRKKWIVAIRRKNFTVSEHSCVCELHFNESDFDTEASAFDSKTGRTITCSLSRKRLKKGVIPSIIPSSSSAASREDPEVKRMRIEKEQLNLALQQSLDNAPETESHLENDADTSNTRSDRKKGPKRKRCDTGIISNNDVNGDCDSINSQVKNSRVGLQIESVSYRQVSSNSVSEAKIRESYINEVQIKEEAPWEEEYGYLENCSKNNEENANNVEAKEVSSENCDTSFYKKPLEINKRDKAFGKFIACEMSDLRVNPELYLKTQQSILKLLVEAHFEQMNSVQMS